MTYVYTEIWKVHNPGTPHEFRSQERGGCTGPFADRRVAEQAAVALAAHPETASVSIEEAPTE